MLIVFIQSTLNHKNVLIREREFKDSFDNLINYLIFLFTFPVWFMLLSHMSYKPIHQLGNLIISATPVVYD